MRRVTVFRTGCCFCFYFYKLVACFDFFFAFYVVAVFTCFVRRVTVFRTGCCFCFYFYKLVACFDFFFAFYVVTVFTCFMRRVTVFRTSCCFCFYFYKLVACFDFFFAFYVVTVFTCFMRRVTVFRTSCCFCFYFYKLMACSNNPAIFCDFRLAFCIREVLVTTGASPVCAVTSFRTGCCFCFRCRKGMGMRFRLRSRSFPCEIQNGQTVFVASFITRTVVYNFNCEITFNGGFKNPFFRPNYILGILIFFSGNNLRISSIGCKIRNRNRYRKLRIREHLRVVHRQLGDTTRKRRRGNFTRCASLTVKADSLVGIVGADNGELRIHYRTTTCLNSRVNSLPTIGCGISVLVSRITVSVGCYNRIKVCRTTSNRNYFTDGFTTSFASAVFSGMTKRFYFFLCYENFFTYRANLTFRKTCFRTGCCFAFYCYFRVTGCCNNPAVFFNFNYAFCVCIISFTCGAEEVCFITCFRTGCCFCFDSLEVMFTSLNGNFRVFALFRTTTGTFFMLQTSIGKRRSLIYNPFVIMTKRCDNPSIFYHCVHAFCIREILSAYGASPVCAVTCFRTGCFFCFRFYKRMRISRRCFQSGNRNAICSCLCIEFCNFKNINGSSKLYCNFTINYRNRCAGNSFIRVNVFSVQTSTVKDKFRHALVFNLKGRRFIETCRVCIITNLASACCFIVGYFNAVLFPNLLFFGESRTICFICKADCNFYRFGLYSAMFMTANGTRTIRIAVFGYRNFFLRYKYFTTDTAFATFRPTGCNTGCFLTSNNNWFAGMIINERSYNEVRNADRASFIARNERIFGSADRIEFFIRTNIIIGTINVVYKRTEFFIIRPNVFRFAIFNVDIGSGNYNVEIILRFAVHEVDIISAFSRFKIEIGRFAKHFGGCIVVTIHRTCEIERFVKILLFKNKLECLTYFRKEISGTYVAYQILIFIRMRNFFNNFFAFYVITVYTCFISRVTFFRTSCLFSFFILKSMGNYSNNFFAFYVITVFTCFISRITFFRTGRFFTFFILKGMTGCFDYFLCFFIVTFGTCLICLVTVFRTGGRFAFYGFKIVTTSRKNHFAFYVITFGTCFICRVAVFRTSCCFSFFSFKLMSCGEYFFAFRVVTFRTCFVCRVTIFRTGGSFCFYVYKLMSCGEYFFAFRVVTFRTCFVCRITIFRTGGGFCFYVYKLMSCFNHFLAFYVITVFTYFVCRVTIFRTGCFLTFYVFQRMTGCGDCFRVAVPAKTSEFLFTFHCTRCLFGYGFRVGMLFDIFFFTAITFVPVVIFVVHDFNVITFVERIFYCTGNTTDDPIDTVATCHYAKRKTCHKHHTKD